MVTAKYHRGVVIAGVATVGLGWCVAGLAQTTAAPAAPGGAAPAAPTSQVAPPTTVSPGTRGIRVGNAPVAAPMPHHAHTAGERHAFVEKIQTALNSSGASLTVDGRWGPKTSAAVKAYQQQHNLKVTGRADKATREALSVN